jgi:hypothetical protein
MKNGPTWGFFPSETREKNLENLSYSDRRMLIWSIKKYFSRLILFRDNFVDLSSFLLCKPNFLTLENWFECCEVIFTGI